MMLSASSLAESDTRWRRRRRKFRYALRAAAALFAALLLWLGWLLMRIESFHGVPASAPGLRADAGIVLGASLWNDKPSPGLQERLDLALKLYRDGVEQGVPENAIRLDNDSYSTYDNLRYSRRIMEAEGWRTAVIVTHRYHGARAADIARTLGYDPVMVSVTESSVMNMNYHTTREVLAFAKWELTKLRLAFG